MGDMADDISALADAYEDAHERGNEPITIPFIRIVHETPAAWLLLFDEGATVFDDSKQEWFPKSRCSLDENASEITIPEWLAIEKDLV